METLHLGPDCAHIDTHEPLIWFVSDRGFSWYPFEWHQHLVVTPSAALDLVRMHQLPCIMLAWDRDQGGIRGDLASLEHLEYIVDPDGTLDRIQREHHDELIALNAWL